MCLKLLTMCQTLFTMATARRLELQERIHVIRRYIMRLPTVSHELLMNGITIFQHSRLQSQQFKR